MPINRNESTRHRILDQLLRESARNPMTIHEIVEALNERLESDWNSKAPFTPIAPRTVQEDIRTMRKNYGVDIQVNGRRNATYTYPDPYTSIHHQGLRPEEAQDVRHALLQLIRFVSHEQFRFLTHGDNGGALGHLFRMFLPEEDSRMVDLLDSDETRVLFDSSIEEYIGNQWLVPLIEASAEQTILRVKYKPFSGVESEFDFHPYILKQYNNRWYCYGHDPEPHRVLASGHKVAFEHKHIALDRIVAVRSLRKKELEERAQYRPRRDKFIKSTIDWEGREFSQRIGVSGALRSEEKTSDVKIKFTARQFGYERTKPLHHSFRVDTQHRDKSVTCRYRLQPNVEFIQRLCALRDQAEVIEPQWLREEVAATVNSMAQLYLKD